MSSEGGLVKRRVTSSSSNDNNIPNNLNRSRNNNSPDNNDATYNEPDIFDTGDSHAVADIKNLKLTLMEQVFLLGLKDKQGHTSFWNDCISIGLRGCILAELVLRKRIALEKVTNRRREPLSSRKVIIVNIERTGDALLDEALNHIHETSPAETIHSWVHYLSGETWNPFNMRFQLKNVRERIAKSLVEKGVLTTEKRKFYLFEMTSHPLVNVFTKKKIVTQVQEAVLTKWINDPHRMDKRLLSLLILAYYSDVIENAFNPLSDDDYEMAMTRVRKLVDLDMEEEGNKPYANEALWAVFSSISK